jgi:hypothetical protein
MRDSKQKFMFNINNPDKNTFKRIQNAPKSPQFHPFQLKKIKKTQKNLKLSKVKKKKKKWAAKRAKTTPATAAPPLPLALPLPLPLPLALAVSLAVAVAVEVSLAVAVAHWQSPNPVLISRISPIMTMKTMTVTGATGRIPTAPMSTPQPAPSAPLPLPVPLPPGSTWLPHTVSTWRSLCPHQKLHKSGTSLCAQSS